MNNAKLPLESEKLITSGYPHPTASGFFMSASAENTIPFGGIISPTCDGFQLVGAH